MLYPARGLKMRLLIAGTFSFPEGGGASARAVHMQAKGLAELGHEVTVATCRGTLDPGETCYDGFRVVSFDRMADCGVGSRKHDRISWIKSQIGLLFYLTRSVIGRSFDYIIFYGSAPVFLPVSVVGSLMKNYTCLIKGDLLVIPWWRVIVERFLSINSEWIIVNGSSLLKKHFFKIAPNTKSIRVWPPTDIKMFSVGNPAVFKKQHGLTNKKLVVYIGAINSLEGIHILLQAMRLVVDIEKEAVLVLAGSISKVDPIEGRPLDYHKIANDLGIANYVIFTGFLSLDEVVNLLAAADVLVNPKIDHPANRAAAPIKLGEYLASERPVVSTKVCELDHWLKDKRDVLFCEEGNPVDLKGRIVDLLQDSFLVARLGKQGSMVALSKCHYTHWASVVSAKFESSLKVK
jgi:glycosyltransferase involved in cell wall biosynthesis